MRPSRLLLPVLCFLSLTASTAAQSSHKGRLLKVTIPAPSLANNQLGDPVVQPALVYLPPDYDSSSASFPVLYLLHGFSLHPTLNDWGEVVQESLDHFLAAQPDRPFIVVIPNGFNAVDGSFYENSAVSGDWDTFISGAVVRYADANFRTLKNRASRAIAGHSMGGFAALRMLMLHPDVFSVGYALSPCCLDFVGDFTASNPEWKNVLQLKSLDDIKSAANADQFWTMALAAFAISTTPDPKSKTLALYPYALRSQDLVDVPSVIQQWKAAMPLNMFTAHLPDLQKATAIGIDYGFEDPFSHIRMTVPEFADRLLKAGIPTEVGAYHGDHNNGVPDRFERVVVPFVAANLAFSDQPSPKQ
jgi:S-formylglutathione hydrolase FrmB